MSRRESLYLSAGLLVALVLIAGSVYLVVGDPRYRQPPIDGLLPAGRLFDPLPLPTRAIAVAFPTPSLPEPPPAAEPPVSPTVGATAANSPPSTPESAENAQISSPAPGTTTTAPGNLTPTFEPAATGNGERQLAAGSYSRPADITLNGLEVDRFIVLSRATRDHVRELYLLGQELGRDGRAFSRLGTSTFATYHFLGRWDDGPYELGDYAFLEPAIDYFSGSFAHLGQAAKVGLTSWGALDPIWATDRPCQPAETPLACELRLHNPAVLLIGLGTNDIAPGNIFEHHMRQILEECLDQGVIPILATKADRYEGEDNRNNETVRRLAAAYRVPLWDFDLVAGTLPGHGVGRDEVHMGFYDPYDYSVAAGFERGYGLFNLSALMALHAVYLEVQAIDADGLPAAPTLAVER
jgi:hypothetical protein